MLRHFCIHSQHQQMIFLRLKILVVNFLANQDYQFPACSPQIPLDSIYPDVMVGDDNAIQPGINGCIGNLRMRASAIGKPGMHV